MRSLCAIQFSRNRKLPSGVAEENQGGREQGTWSRSAHQRCWLRRTREAGSRGRGAGVLIRDAGHLTVILLFCY